MCGSILSAAVVSAQTTTQPPAAATSAYDPDYAVQPTEPDFTLINLPTTLRLPTHKSDFHLTHRFLGNLEKGSFTDQLSNLFGLDNGAAIGLEYRFGIMRHLQGAVYRTNVDKETQFSAKWDPIEQSDSRPLSISGAFSIEGANNFRRDYAPAVGAVISRRVGQIAALYANPTWVHNTGPSTDLVKRDTGFIGLGGRLHARPAMYLVAEVSPRIGGYVTGQPEFSFGLEGRVGGHVFQLNFSNTTGTTTLQTAHGGFPSSLYLGFNLARKFY